MSWKDLNLWLLYSEIEPWGEERGDLRAGIVASTIANVHRDRKKQGRAFKPSDFMPKFDEEAKSQRKPLTSIEEWNRVKSTAKSIASA